MFKDLEAFIRIDTLKRVGHENDIDANIIPKNVFNNQQEGKVDPRIVGYCMQADFNKY